MPGPRGTMTARWTCNRRAVLGLMLCVQGWTWWASAAPAFALEELKGEKKAISACELQLCTMLVHKERKGPDLKCDLVKTWGRKTIKDAETSQLNWGFGDARCTVKLNVSRADIVGAIVAQEGKFRLPPQTVDCIVEEKGEAKNVRVVVSPKIEFHGGQAKKIWINLVSTDGPFAVTSLVRFAVQLEDGLGLFHHALLKSVNGFINKSCPKVLEAAKEKEKERAKAVAARAKVPKPAKKPEAAADPAVVASPAKADAASPAPKKEDAPAKEETKKGEPAKAE